MFHKLFPSVIDNTFRGKRIALYAFYPIAAVTLIRSCIHLFALDGGAQTIATIPLDSFSAEVSSVVIGVFALWGLSQLLLGVLYLIASIWYKSLIPLFYLLLVVEYIGRFAIGHIKPILTTGTAPGAALNLPVVILVTILLLLSISGTGKKGGLHAERGE